jgi:flagellar motor switch protein FliN
MSSLPTSSSSSDRGRLGDVVCAVSVQLGTGRLSVRHLLALEPDTVLRLGQGAGEDLQLLVHGVAIATGEVVIIENSTVLRVTQLSTVSTEEEGT